MFQSQNPFIGMEWDDGSKLYTHISRSAYLLEELHISAGMQTGWRHNWFVDHDAIRNILCPLRKLKIFAILRDSYQMNDSLRIVEPDAYYEYRIPSADEYADFVVQHQQSAHDDRRLESMRDLWEKLHARRITQQAKKYAVSFRTCSGSSSGSSASPFRNTLMGKQKLCYPLPKEMKIFQY
ncbi:hypothetical protein DPV78_008230 [Talaromyces pinophilus]|nr:hypothetical protein DPV78_008230 [Talaromyces pinophilus]